MNGERTTTADRTPSLLPIRGNDATEILVNDHVVIKSLLSELTAGRDLRTRAATLERLVGVLTIHNATEENFVYPALAVIAGKKTQSQHLYHETAAADLLVFELDTMLKTGDDAKFAATAEELQAAILEHIDDEENKAFERLRKHADPVESARLTEAVRMFRANLQYALASP